MFLKLTLLSNGSKIRINVDEIIDYFEHNSKTEIMTRKNLILVKETPEQIDKALQEAYVTIKEIYNEQACNGSSSTNTKSDNTNLGSSNSGHEATE